MYMKHAYVKVMCTLTDIHVKKKIFSIHKAIGDDLLVVVGSHFQTDIQYRRLRSFCTSPLSTLDVCDIIMTHEMMRSDRNLSINVSFY